MFRLLTVAPASFCLCLTMPKLPRLLITDSSKVVRASLAKKLKAHFDIREEDNGESARQTLILDSSIVAVISGVALPKLDGVGLLESVRSNKLGRLKTMPFFLIASDAMQEEIRQHAIAGGVSGFIPKDSSAADTLDILGMASEPCQGRQQDVRVCDGKLLSLVDGTADFGRVEAAKLESGQQGAELATRSDINLLLSRLLASDDRCGVGVLLFGVDGYSGLIERFGLGMANRIETKFEQLLAGKLRAEDRIAKLAANRIVIVASDTSLKQCSSFAERICKRLAAAEVSIGGSRVSITVSVGFASFPDEGAGVSGEEMLSVAEQRLDSAIRDGGNRVVGCPILSAEGDQREALRRFEECLGAVRADALAPHLGQVGLLILPLLREIECSLGLGMPIEKMELLLKERSRTELAIG